MATFTIAVAGKGGVGKTSFCSLLIRWLIENKRTPILAVDADPNSNLSEALGVGEIEETISEIISLTKEIDGIPVSMSQDEFISYKLSSALTETKNFDLLAMGGPQGPGCYCFPNNVLKKHLTKLEKNYQTVVMDNEAGMEHISRGTTTEHLDALFILSDTSRRSVRSAARIKVLTKDLGVPVKNIYFVLTRAQEGDIETLGDELKLVGLPLAGVVPNDETITKYELAGRALYELPSDAPSVVATTKILNETLGGN
ncbi:cobyrinic acid a,c-diamide synthase [Synergistales bacterium]|nr:cobyrinic acid a,c-diamide synthase [Synergistales bacterium]